MEGYVKYELFLDGQSYHVIIPQEGIKRSFSILDGENSGRTQDGKMVRDIIGTYYNYNIQVLQDLDYPEDYDKLYEEVSAPVNYHQLIAPYGQNIYQFNAYITDGEDTLTYIHPTNNMNVWSGLSLNFVAMDPKRIPKK